MACQAKPRHPAAGWQVDGVPGGNVNEFSRGDEQEGTDQGCPGASGTLANCAQLPSFASAPVRPVIVLGFYYAPAHLPVGANSMKPVGPSVACRSSADLVSRPGLPSSQSQHHL